MPRLPEAIDAGQAAMRDIHARSTPDEKWNALRAALTNKRLSDPDARFVRDALLQVMDILNEPEEAKPTPRAERAQDANAPVEIGNGVTITPNEKGEITGDEETDRNL